jgi:uncharacterized protein YdeI (YjbR/CyaY-like superfamily)
MVKKDPRVDAYIAKSADFAKPVLRHVRKLVHATCPTAEETIKWGSPFFVDRGILCGIAAFKQHCALIFWRPEVRSSGSAKGKPEKGLGDYGKITGLDDLPSDAELKRRLKLAMSLNATGVKRPAPRRKPKPSLDVPRDLSAALQGNKQARTTFESLSPSKKRDYVEWIEEAKQAETRARRLTTALAWLAEGKSRNWKYERK